MVRRSVPYSIEQYVIKSSIHIILWEKNVIIDKNRIQRIFVALVATALFLASAPAQAAGKGSADNSVGRFELHEKTYQHEEGGKVINKNDVFLLDTTTGRTWIFVSKVNKDGQLAKYWVEFSDRVDKK